tara:strand:+ start:511 stop:708 length:198 start_codon:yes stop_codon:yes gene_type:complete
MKNFFKSLSIKELQVWINKFDNYKLLNQFLDNSPSEEDIKLAKKILKNKRKYLLAQINKDTYITF